MAVSAGASSAHFGGALSITEIISTLFAHQMKIDKKNPTWEERDRFILSKGHACLALYAILYEKGLINKETIVCTHWETKSNFIERYPDIKIVENIYTINANGLMFAAGGISTLDLILECVKKIKGKDVGMTLKKIEKWWVKNDFFPLRKECLIKLKSI